MLDHSPSGSDSRFSGYWAAKPLLGQSHGNRGDRSGSAALGTGREVGWGGKKG